MLIAEGKKKYTVADYDLLEDGAPFQLINYDLVMSPSPIPEHQFISGRLFSAITAYLDQNNNEGAIIYAPMDVFFDEGNVLQPDLLFVAENRKEIIQQRIEGAPDLIIEILSPSNAYYDLRQKKEIYEKYGVKEYIIIDPMAQNADLYILKEGIYHLHQKAQKTEQLNSVLLSGLVIDLQKIFK